MAVRPLRTYLHTFVNTVTVTDALRIPMGGRTPCLARGAAFRELERILVDRDLPRQGWKLIKQEPVNG